MRRERTLSFKTLRRKEQTTVPIRPHVLALFIVCRMMCTILNHCSLTCVFSRQKRLTRSTVSFFCDGRDPLISCSMLTKVRRCRWQYPPLLVDEGSSCFGRMGSRRPKGGSEGAFNSRLVGKLKGVASNKQATVRCYDLQWKEQQNNQRLMSWWAFRWQHGYSMDEGL
jgi:hypothetical protein